MKKIKEFLFSKTTFSIFISAILLVYVFQSIDIEKVWSGLLRARLDMLLLVVALSILQIILRGWRWRYLLPKQQEELSVKLLLDASQLGNLGNFTLPLRAGEFIRPWMLSKFSKISYPTALASVVTERFFDLSMVLIFFAVVVLSFQDMQISTIELFDKTIKFEDFSANLIFAAKGFSLLAAAVFIFIISGSLCSDFTMRCLRFFLKPFPVKFASIFAGIAEQFIKGAHVLRNPINLLMVVFLSALIWGLTVYTYWIGFLMFDGTASLGMYAALVLTTVLALGVAVPSAPGFIGVFEVSCIIAFAIVGVGRDDAVTYALVNHILQYLIIFIWGGYVLVSYGIKFNEIAKKK